MWDGERYSLCVCEREGERDAWMEWGERNGYAKDGSDPLESHARAARAFAFAAAAAAAAAEKRANRMMSGKWARLGTEEDGIAKSKTSLVRCRHPFPHF